TRCLSDWSSDVCSSDLIKKDSCMSRQGVPDYLVTMRKAGDNPERVTHTNDDFPVELWQSYASPVWMDINPHETLQFRSAREHQRSEERRVGKERRSRGI